MKIFAILILILLFLPCKIAVAARCFGSTCGSGASDSILTSSFSLPNKYSFSGWFYGNSFLNVTTPRLYNMGFTTASDSLAFFTSGTLIIFQSSFSITQPQWTVPSPSLSAWHNIVVVYDGSSTSNNPSIYIDGTSQSVTRVIAPIGTKEIGTTAMFIGNVTAANRNFDGKLADYALWGNILLTSNEIMALAKGVSPFNIHYKSLLIYLPLTGTPPREPDWSPSKLTQTITGTVKTSSPPIQSYPFQWVDGE